MTFEPDLLRSPFTHARKRSRDEVLGTLVRASSYLKPYKLQLFGVFLLIVVVTFCSLSFPAS